ncbi:histidine phosphatase family protein [Kineothrix sp. MB12-C1]|uniref:histidine phosphatase family protein n=1 Tax=Kineothrix sp. MB12-C1 TaxID=3070215 RepID=UPI0027D2917D|nr:histidine phosphatase family protein [Kineothrix sp. MB12-C1]WMC92539.1 histidine phosphatase family protein [Kineothrix sp. MB12-C1]
MTGVYFVRHAEPNYMNHNDELRELTEKGLSDRKLVTDFLKDKSIDVVLSSPYKRSIDTVKDFADKYGHQVVTVSDFRERKIDSVWIDDFTAFCQRQWIDFDYKLTDGETLREVQARNINALKWVLKEYRNKNIVVGSHGTALSTIINYYDASFGYSSFNNIKGLMPWIVKFTFEEDSLQSIEILDVFA